MDIFKDGEFILQFKTKSEFLMYLESFKALLINDNCIIPLDLNKNTKEVMMRTNF